MPDLDGKPSSDEIGWLSGDYEACINGGYLTAAGEGQVLPMNRHGRGVAAQDLEPVTAPTVP